MRITVLLESRKCYSFVRHVQWLISNVDKEDKSNLKRGANREWEDIMAMLREVILYQYENSPTAVAYFRERDNPCSTDPLQTMLEVNTPASLDQVCVCVCYASCRHSCMGVCVCLQR